MKICLKCMTRYADNVEVGRCILYNCYGTVVEIDDDIAESIILLNKKGYETKFCCSGHADNDSCFAPYLVFTSFDTDDMVYLDKLEGYEYITYDNIKEPIGALAIYYKGHKKYIDEFEELTVQEKMYHKYIAMTALYNWVISLPIKSKGVCDYNV